jgi:NDP-sugar pyrophosphorylase family protein
MKNIEPFFSLEQFAHKNLWEKGSPIWSALVILSKYLKEIPLGRIEIEVPKGVILEKKELISIGKGTVIEPGVMIKGPCIIGKNCTISHGAYVREEVILGNDCHIGHSTEVKHSILLDGAKATHFVYVGDSILGNAVNLGAGVKCANLRLDRGDIWVEVDGKKVNTGLKKLGAIVGDLVQIGCNSVLNPGTLMGKESFSYPLMNLGGFIPARSQISSEGIYPIEQKTLERLLCQKLITSAAK